MPTVTKITLDSADYKTALEDVVNATRAGRQAMEAAGGGEIKSTVRQEVKGRTDVRDAKKELNELEKETAVGVTASVEGEASVDSLDEKIKGIPKKTSITVIADTQGSLVPFSGASAGGAGESAGGAAENAGNQAQQSGQKAEDAHKKWKKFAEQISRGGGAVNAFSTMIGAVSPQLTILGQALGAVASGMLGVITIAAGLTVALSIDVWDRLTVSMDEAISKASMWLGVAQRAQQREEARAAEAQKYLDKLREVSAAQGQQTNVTLMTSVAIRALERRYGDLGAEIDKTTGKLLNYGAVARRVSQMDAKKQADAIAETVKNMNDIQLKEYEVARKGERGGWRSQGMEQLDVRSFANLTTGEERLARLKKEADEGGKTDESIKRYAALIERQEESNRLEKERISLLTTGYRNKEEQEAALAAKRAEVIQSRQLVEQLEKEAARRKADSGLSRITNPQDKISSRQALIDAEKSRQDGIQKDIDAADRELRASGPKKPEADLESEKRKLAAIAELKKSQAEVASLEDQIKQITFDQAEVGKKLLEQSKFEVDYAKLIAAGEYDKASALKQQHELKQQNLVLTEAEKQAILDNQKALQQIETGKRISEGKDELEIQRALLAGDFDRVNLLKLQLEYKRQGKALSKEDQDALLKQQKESQKIDTEKAIEEGKMELEIQRLNLAGEYEKADILKRQLEYKRQGKALDKEQEASLKKQQDARNAMNLQKSMKDQGKSLLYGAMEQAGMGREAAYAKALDDAEKTKGAKLTQEETDRTKKYTDLSLQLSTSIPVQLGDLGIKTNDLTARGGFASGAVMPDKDEINRAIRSNTQYMLEVLRSIETWVGKVDGSIKEGNRN